MMDFLGLSLSSLGAAGTLALLFALCFSMYALVVGVWAGKTAHAGLAHEALEQSARLGLQFNFVCVTIALLLLQYAILNDDFTVRYVAHHSMSVSPLWVKWVTLWAALEGSILLWAWILSLYAFLVSLTACRDVLRPWVLAVMALSVVFFVGVNLTVASPFTPVAEPPLEGRGPNPLLQNHWMMAVHPVLMYLGFVGLSVPFAYAVAAMLTGRLGSSWLVQTRRWSMLAWAFLSAAIVTGGWWSYEILGWGGYWAWDPVENASFIPWLLATAFLHSVQIQERRRILKTWNIYLIVLAYAATVLGTFLTRSGVVESVHAFGSGPIGPLFLGFFMVLLVLGVGLATWRMPNIRDPHSLDHPLSREGAVLGGNMLFVMFALLVVIGTLFPVFVEALRGIRTSVGESFYNFFAIPLGLALLLFMGLGPLLPWRRLKRSLYSLLRWPVLAIVLAMVLAVVLGIRNVGLIGCVGLCAFNVVALGQLTLESALARSKRDAASNSKGDLHNLHNLHSLHDLPKQLWSLFREHPRRYGAYVAHLGVVVLSLGIGFSSTYKAKQEITLHLNKPQTVLGKTMTLSKLEITQTPYRASKIATIQVGHETLYPKLNAYRGQPQAVTMPAVKYHFLGDTYVTLLASEPDDNWATVALIDSPLVAWIWWGTGILLLGTAISLNAPVRELTERTELTELAKLKPSERSQASPPEPLPEPPQKLPQGEQE